MCLKNLEDIFQFIFVLLVRFLGREYKLFLVDLLTFVSHPVELCGDFLLLFHASVGSPVKQEFNLVTEAFPFCYHIGGIPIEAWLIEWYVHVPISHDGGRWFRFAH